jgi:peroxiredoxin
MRVGKVAILLLIAILLISAKPQGSKILHSFTLNDITGKQVVLDSIIKNGPAIISFWALWCKMCIKELDALKPFYHELDSLGVRFLAVNQDQAKAKSKVHSFVSAKKWPYTILLDPNSKVRNLYNIQVLPTTFIVTPKREIFYIHQGYRPGDEKKLVSAVKSLLISSKNESQ